MLRQEPSKRRTVGSKPTTNTRAHTPHSKLMFPILIYEKTKYEKKVKFVADQR